MAKWTQCGYKSPSTKKRCIKQARYHWYGNGKDNKTCPLHTPRKFTYSVYRID